MSDSHKNVYGAEAQDKIKEIVKHARSCQMMTALDKRPIPSRPMGLLKIDDAGRIYFISHKDSEKNQELAVSNEMQIQITNDKDNEYLSLYGTADVYRDQKQIDELYTAFADNWFEDKNDANISIIRFAPEKGHYWDTKHGKFIQFTGMLIGALTGKNASDGIEGKISV